MGSWCKNDAVNNKVLVCVFSQSKSTNFGVYALKKRSWPFNVVVGSLLLFLLLCEPKEKGYMQIPHLHQCQIQQSSLLSCSDIKLLEFSLTAKLEECLHMLCYTCYWGTVRLQLPAINSSGQ